MAAQCHTQKGRSVTVSTATFAETAILVGDPARANMLAA
jgi:hypothetical protein